MDIISLIVKDKFRKFGITPIVFTIWITINSHVSFAQLTETIWLEDFTLSDGTTVDNGATSWSANDPPGIFSVDDYEFEVSDISIYSEGVWTSGSIDISGKTDVYISVDIRSHGVEMNTSGIFMDYLRIYYKLDGGSEILFSENLGSIGSSYITVSSGSLSGTNLQVVIRARATSSYEFYCFDNVEITATTPLTATASANGILTCTVSSVTLSGSSNTAGVTYSWEGPDGFSSTIQNPVVTDTGVYTLTVTNPGNGYTAEDTARVIQNRTDPGATASTDDSLTCTITSVTLSGNSGTAGVTFTWSGPNDFNSTEQNPSVSFAGTYALTVTDPINGCTSSDSVTVKQNITLPGVLAGVTGIISCTAASVTLSGSSNTFSATYSWSGPNNFSSTEQNPSVDVAGIYILTVTDTSNGCTNADSVQVVSSTGATDTIWLEDFALSDGTTEDNGATSWSATDPPGIFSVDDNEFKVSATGTSDEGVWTSDLINISGKSDVHITVDIRSYGAWMNSYGPLMDYLRLYYKLDGGSEVLFNENRGSISSATTVSAGPLSGTNLQIVIRARTTYTNEFYYFDNIKVIGSNQIDASISVSGLLTCTDTTVVLYGNSNVSGVSYSWSDPGSFTSLLQNPKVNTPGTYSLTVTDTSNGCYSVVSTEVNQDIIPPGASTDVSGQLSCTNATVTLLGSSSTSNVTYCWYGPSGFSSSDQNPIVNTLGTYTLTVTNPTNGCTSSSSIEVTSVPSEPTTLWLEDFSLSDGTTEDNGATSWSANDPPGVFSVKYNRFKVSDIGTSSEGVWTSGTIDISGKTDVYVTANVKSYGSYMNSSGPLMDYLRLYYKLDGGSEVLFSENLGSISSSYITVSSGFLSGTSLQIVIRARATYDNEFYFFDDVEVIGTDQIVDTITTTVSGPITCQDQNVQLTASVEDTTATYYWIDPDNITINQQNPVVNKPGDYTVVVSVGGCQASKTVTVSGSTDIPDVSISGDHLDCNTNDPVILNAISSNTNLTYSWTGPAGFTSNEKSPSVSNAGTYIVTVTDQTNLCTNTASFNVEYRTLLWDENFDDLEDGTIEDLGSTAWNIDNSQIHTVDLSDYTYQKGIPYYFEVRDNRLAAKSTRGEVVWTSYPIDISGTDSIFTMLDVSGEGILNDSTNCLWDCFAYDYIHISYKLDGGEEIPFDNFGYIPGKLALSDIKASSYIPDGSTLQIVIKAYNTGNDELFYFDNIQVLTLGQGGIPVTVSVSGPITCEDSIVTLTASPNIAGNNYNWIGPNGFTSDQPVTEVDQPGTYTLIVEGITGSLTSDTLTIEVMQDIDYPDLSISPAGTLTCITSTVGLNAVFSTPNTLITWNGGDPGENPVFVSIPGTYIVTAINNNNGCTTQDSAIVAQDNTLPGAMASVNNLLTCAVTSTVLTASSPTPGVSFTWTGPDGYHSTMKNTVTSIHGEYVLSVTNPLNGCLSKDTITVQQNIAEPEDVIASVEDMLTCIQTSVTLSGSSGTSGVTYEWSGPDNFGSTEQNPQVTIPGNYSLLVTDPGNGCSSLASVQVEQDTTYPSDVLATVSGILTCTDTTVTLTGSSGSGEVTYSWLDPNSITLTGNPVAVSVPGTYILTVTSTVSGCSRTANVTVEQDMEAPEGLTASVSDTLSCTVTSVILSASSTTIGVTYFWEGPEGFISNEQYTITSIPGNYSVTATNPNNGCISVEQVVVSGEECQVP